MTGECAGLAGGESGGARRDGWHKTTHDLATSHSWLEKGGVSSTVLRRTTRARRIAARRVSHPLIGPMVAPILHILSRHIVILELAISPPELDYTNVYYSSLARRSSSVLGRGASGERDELRQKNSATACPRKAVKESRESVSFQACFVAQGRPKIAGSPQSSLVRDELSCQSVYFSFLFCLASSAFPRGYGALGNCLHVRYDWRHPLPKELS